jgi:predicted acetyltransferase
VDALERGWSPDNVGGLATARRFLDEIAADARAFVGRLDDREARAGPIRLPDGTEVPRLPGFNRWIWDGEFSGNFSFRWRPGGESLPDHVLGHIGYAVVPWKEGRGYASRGLRLLLPEVRALGLRYVDLTTEPDNIASQKVILANGGYLLGPFKKAPAYGGAEALRFRIDL